MTHVPWTLPPCRFLMSLTVPHAALWSQQRPSHPRWPARRGQRVHEASRLISSQTVVHTTLPGSRLELSTTLWGWQCPTLLSGSQTPALAPWLWPLAGLSRFHRDLGASQVAQWVKNAVQEMQVPSPHQEDPLEKGVAPHSSILAWRIPGTEEPGRV